MDIDVRLYPLLVALGVAPVVWYLTANDASVVALSVLSLVILAAAVWIMFTGGVPGLGQAG